MHEINRASWQYQGGNCVVYEVEHLFGYDLILAQVEEGVPAPKRVVSRERALTEWERRLARRWCNAYDMADWPTLTATEVQLHRE